MALSNLEHLAPAEQQALADFARRLRDEFDGGVCSALLFGSKARAESRPDSDLDVLVVVDSDDWRVHKRVRYIAADICFQYGLDLSPRVWSSSHLQEVEALQTLLYQNIVKDAIALPGLQ
jgi:predicted nucleotidyltransferase